MNKLNKIMSIILIVMFSITVSLDLYLKDYRGALTQFTLLCFSICIVFNQMTIANLEKSNEALRGSNEMLRNMLLNR